MNILYYNPDKEKKTTTKNTYIRRNNSNFGNRYENKVYNYSEGPISRKKGYYTHRYRINNNNQ